MRVKRRPISAVSARCYVLIQTRDCREIKSPQDARLPDIRTLYETTLDRAERIPWAWIVGGLGRRFVGKRYRLFAAEDGGVQGYCFGAHLAGYGGYVSYVGVAPSARGRGVGKRLYHAAFRAFRRDARRRDESLPFVVWESRRPAADDPPEVYANWRARLRLFEKVGGLWLSGAAWSVPNYMDEQRPPVQLELFLRPVDRHDYDTASLRSALDGLAARIYRMPPGDAPAGELRLRPIRET